MGQTHKILGDRFVVRNLFQVAGVWYARIRDRQTNKMTKISTRERSRRKADQAVLRWVEGRISRVEETLKVMAFGEAFETWLGLRLVRPSTRRDYESARRVYLAAFGDGRAVDEITPLEVEKFLRDMSKSGRAATTGQKYLTILRSFYQWAMRQDFCRSNPTEAIKAARGAKRSGVALTQEEARRFLSACQETVVKTLKDGHRNEWQQGFPPPDHLFLAALISLHTGLRRGNVTGLTWREVDLKKRKITIAAGKMKANADHIIPIHTELVEKFAEKQKEQMKIAPDEPVIGKAIEEIRKSFKSALKRADLPDIRWHDLRHTFATWVGQKATFVVYRALLGHSPGSVSERYFHPPFEELQRVIDSMPHLLTSVSASSDVGDSSLKTGQTS